MSTQDRTTPWPEGRPLAGKVALVAGATRGAGRGIAVALGAAGATVYCSGRTTRERRSDYDRPETIEETAELVDAAGGTGVVAVVDHLDGEQVRALVGRIDAEQGCLDVLVNDIGGEVFLEWGKPLWAHDLAKGLHLLRTTIDTHLITSHHALPLLLRTGGGLVVEVTDGTADYNGANFRINPFYDLAKYAAIRLAFAQGTELAPHGATAVAVSPGWLRSESMLEAYGVTEDTWRDALDRPLSAPDGTAAGHFGISETPAFVGRAVVSLAIDPDRHRWNTRSTSSGDLAKEYGFTDLDGSRPDAWRYLVEVQDAGKPPNVAPYR
jgi:NAD(P)-dependent dehydrogenase (short-subunit alcohol dehydrogenase family)